MRGVSFGKREKAQISRDKMLRIAGDGERRGCLPVNLS